MLSSQTHLVPRVLGAGGPPPIRLKHSSVQQPGRGLPSACCRLPSTTFPSSQCVKSSWDLGVALWAPVPCSFLFKSFRKPLPRNGALVGRLHPRTTQKVHWVPGGVCLPGEREQTRSEYAVEEVQVGDSEWGQKAS